MPDAMLLPDIVGIDVCVAQYLEKQAGTDGSRTMHGNGDPAAVRAAKHRVASRLTIKTESTGFYEPHDFAGG